MSQNTFFSMYEHDAYNITNLFTLYISTGSILRPHTKQRTKNPWVSNFIQPNNKIIMEIHSNETKPRFHPTYGISGVLCRIHSLLLGKLMKLNKFEITNIIQFIHLSLLTLSGAWSAIDSVYTMPNYVDHFHMSLSIFSYNSIMEFHS